MLTRTQVQQALDATGGLLRLEPSWIPRSFMLPTLSSSNHNHS